MTETFGQWLKRKCEELNVKPAELSRKSGVSKQYISGLMKDRPHSDSKARPHPRPDTVDKLANALGAPISEARRAAYPAPTDLEGDADPVSLQIFNISRELSPETRETALKVIEAIYRGEVIKANKPVPSSKKSGKLKSA